MEMIRQSFPEEAGRIIVDSTSGLIAEYAARKNARAIIRGLRAVSDFDYEFQLALMNRELERQVDTIFLMPGLRWIYLSSSIIRDAARHGGDISRLVHVHVEAMLKTKYPKHAAQN